MTGIAIMADIVDSIYNSYNIDSGHTFNLRILTRLLIEKIPLFLELKEGYYVALIIFTNIMRLRKNINRSKLDLLFMGDYSDCILFVEFAHKSEQNPQFMSLSVNEKIKLLSEEFMKLQKKRNDICISMNYNEKGVLYDNILRREIHNTNIDDNEQQDEEVCDCDDVLYVDEKCPLCDIQLMSRGNDIKYYTCNECGFTM